MKKPILYYKTSTILGKSELIPRCYPEVKYKWVDNKTKHDVHSVAF